MKYTLMAPILLLATICLLNCGPNSEGDPASEDDFTVGPLSDNATKKGPIKANTAAIDKSRNVLEIPCTAPEGDLLKAYGPKDLIWPNPNLTVGFNGGSTSLKKKVLAIAETWSRHSSLTFREVPFSSAQIRISFDPSGGHWSWVGTHAKRISRKKPTMNLGISDYTSSDELDRVVLHEFGHAIGLLHEHQHPHLALKWNNAAVIAEYAKPPNNWSPAQTRRQILAKNKRSSNLLGTKYDPSSIMHYPVPRYLLTSGKAVGWNRKLSNGDIAWVKHVYPKN